MARKTIYGKCRLCLKEKDLNFEHIPPKCTFNKKTRFQITPFLDLMQSEDPFNPNVSGRIEQGGIGANSFCTDCNNFLGTTYVKAYQSWVLGAAWAIGHGDFVGHDYSIRDQFPNKILKQIISMFLGINTPEFSENNKDLAEFVLDVNAMELDDKYQIFTYLNTRGKTRYIPITVVGNLSNGSTTVCSEITFPPCGFVLTINSTTTSHEGIINITKFKSAIPDNKMEIDLKINKLETHLPIAMDYRTKAEIEAGMKNSR